MPYCPNPECPFRKRFGESAEYRSDIATCSDCDSPLAETDVLGPAVQTKSSYKLFKLSDMHKRIMWTLLLVGFLQTLSHLALPGIDYGNLSRLTGGEDSPFAQLASVRLLSLGLIAYVSSYVLIEMLSLFIEPFKSWRVTGGSEGRAKLVRTARWTTLVMATYHASALVSMMNGLGDGNLLNDNSLAFRCLLVLTLVAGLFLTIWIVDLLSAKGIGHGVSILFLASEVGGLPKKLYRLLSVSLGEDGIAQIIISLLLFAGLVMLIIVVERAVRRISFRRTDGTEVLVPIKLTTAGTIPLEGAGWIIGLPALILGAFSVETQAEQHVLRQLAAAMGSQSFVSIVVYWVVLLVLYYVFTAFFHNPRRISSYIDRTESSEVLSSDALRAVDRSLEVMALAGSLYIFVLAYVQDALWAWFSIPLIMDGLSLLLVGCITLDIVNEVHLRWRSGSLVRVAEFHEPWKAGFFQNVLKEKNIPSFIRGYHHRALLYFFGPYIEMSLFVPREHAGEAQNIVGDYARSVPVDAPSSS